MDSISISMPDGTTTTVQYAASGNGVILLVSGPDLGAGQTGVVAVPNAGGQGVAPGVSPIFGLYVGPVSNAATALGPYV